MPAGTINATGELGFSGLGAFTLGAVGPQTQAFSVVVPFTPTAPAVTSHVYTYWLYDLLTNTPITELRMSAVTFSTVLNDIGAFQGTIDLADPNVQRASPITATQPARTALYVDRDGVIVWGGIIWTRLYQSTDRTLQIGGNDFLSLWQHRFLTTTKQYTNQDPISIASDLASFTKLAAGGDVGITVNVMGGSGVLVSQTWNSWDLKGIEDAIRDLSQSNFGFDYAIDCSWSGGVPTKTLNLTYPRRGRPFSISGLVWEYPGNIANYQYPEDATQMATTVYDVGAGSGATMLLSPMSTPSQIDIGYPLLETTLQYKDVTSATVLAGRATADAVAYSAPVTLPTLQVRSDRDPVLGAYETGDDCRVRLTDSRFPQPSTGGAGLDTYFRITQIDVTPQDTGPEIVQLTLGPPPP